jgi:hypothetical protein
MNLQYNPCTGHGHSDAYPRHRTAGRQRLCKKEEKLINNQVLYLNIVYIGLQAKFETPNFAFAAQV